MKKTFFLLSFFVFASILGQENLIDISILKSDVIKEKKESEIQSIKKDSNGNIYVFRYYDDKKKFLIDKYTSKLKKIESYELDTKMGNIICGGFIEGNKIGFIEYRKNIKKHIVISYDAYLHTSNLESLMFESKKVFEITPDNYPSFFESLSFMNFEGNLTFSRSREFLVFNINSKDKNKGNNKIIVFDKNFNKVWEKEFKLLKRDRKPLFQNLKISDNGDVFVLLKVIFKKTKNKETENYYYEVLKITKDNKITKKLNQQEHFVSLKLELSNENDIACLGFYSDKKENRIKGFCSFILNSKNLNSKNEVFTPLQFFKYRNKDRELKDIIFKKIFHTGDGNIMIHAEEFYINEFYTTNKQFVSEANFDDIITLKVNKNGELIWAKNINKEQTSFNFDFSQVSYGAINIKGGQYLVLNSHKNMRELSNSKITFRESFLWKTTKNNSNLYLGKFDKDGNFTYKFLLQNKDEEVVFITRYAKQVSDNEVILFGHKRKKTQFLKLTFNK